MASEASLPSLLNQAITECKDKTSSLQNNFEDHLKNLLNDVLETAGSK